MPAAKYTLSWSPSAERDLDDVWDYYGRNISPKIGERMLRDIGAVAERVAVHPFSGAPRTALRSGLRSARAAPYLLFYSVDTDKVEIERVLHERRDIEAAFDEIDL